MLPAPQKSSETRAIMLLISGNSEHLEMVDASQTDAFLPKVSGHYLENSHFRETGS
jgi:hypothetical protein